MSHHLSPNPPHDDLRSYSVQVGHTKITVPGRSPAEAIHEARRRLCQENPRMWDMIQQLDESRFEVVCLK